MGTGGEGGRSDVGSAILYGRLERIEWCQLMRGPGLRLRKKKRWNKDA